MDDTPARDDEQMPAMLSWALGLLGGLAGGSVGVVIFGWMLRQGFYGLVLPGLLMGLVGGWAAKRATWPLRVVFAILGLVFGIVAEWMYRPFELDNRLPYFLSHLHDLTPLTLIMIALGAVFAFWFSRPR